MDQDDLGDVLNDASPKCPRCLVLLEASGDDLPYLECPTCSDIWL